MADIDVKQRAEVYRQTLLENVIPFWLRHGLDREHGGILTCLDRDGTVIRECEYLTDPDKVELLPGAAAGLRRMRALGLGLALITNQSAVGRGYMNVAGLAKVHARLEELLRAEAIALVTREPADVMLLDLVMPGLGGLDVLKKVKALGGATEVGIMTAFSDVDAAVTAVKVPSLNPGVT